MNRLSPELRPIRQYKYAEHEIYNPERASQYISLSVLKKRIVSNDTFFKRSVFMLRTHKLYSKSKFYVFLEGGIPEDNIQIVLLCLKSSKKTVKVLSKETQFLNFHYASNPNLVVRFVYKNSILEYRIPDLLPHSIFILNECLKLRISTSTSGVSFVKKINNIPHTISSSLLNIKCPLCPISVYSFQSIAQLLYHCKLSHDYFRLKLLYEHKNVHLFEIIENFTPDLTYLSRSFRLDFNLFTLVPLPFVYLSSRYLFKNHTHLESIPAKCFVSNQIQAPFPCIKDYTSQYVYPKRTSSAQLDFNYNTDEHLTSNYNDDDDVNSHICNSGGIRCPIGIVGYQEHFNNNVNLLRSSPINARSFRKIDFGNRLFVDSFSMQPLSPRNTSSIRHESEAIVHNALIQDFCDLQQEEKDFMVKWNNLLREMKSIEPLFTCNITLNAFLQEVILDLLCTYKLTSYSLALLSSHILSLAEVNGISCYTLQSALGLLKQAKSLLNQPSFIFEKKIF